VVCDSTQSILDQDAQALSQLHNFDEYNGPELAITASFLAQQAHSSLPHEAGVSECMLMLQAAFRRQLSLLRRRLAETRAVYSSLDMFDNLQLGAQASRSMLGSTTTASRPVSAQQVSLCMLH
jgi:hypothetical protein